jgi:hypothetical protein
MISKSRLDRLERDCGCPECSNQPVLLARNRNFYGSEADPGPLDRQAAACARCVRVITPVEVRLVRDPSFYGNAE